MPRMPESLEELDGLLLRVSKHRTVQRDGIHFQGQRYLSPTLAPFVGRTITIRYDPRDLSEIRVYDHDTFVCTAIDEAHRSEDHTSELQSRGHLVCRLLLDNKKNST